MFPKRHVEKFPLHDLSTFRGGTRALGKKYELALLHRLRADMHH